VDDMTERGGAMMMRRKMPRNRSRRRWRVITQRPLANGCRLRRPRLFDRRDLAPLAPEGGDGDDLENICSVGRMRRWWPRWLSSMPFQIEVGMFQRIVDDFKESPARRCG